MKAVKKKQREKEYYERRVVKDFAPTVSESKKLEREILISRLHEPRSLKPLSEIRRYHLMDDL